MLFRGIAVAGLILTFTLIAAAQPDSLWSRAYGGNQFEECWSLDATVDGGWILGGTTASYGAGNRDFWIVKTNASGDSVWSRTFGGSEDEECYSIKQTSDGGYIMAGSTDESFNENGRDYWLVKTDANGDSLWSRTFGGGSNDICYSVMQTPDSGYALGGWSESFDWGWRGFWLVKTDANGDSLWTKYISGNFYDSVSDFVMTEDGGWIVTGWTNSVGAQGRDVWLLKVSASGDSLWSRNYGGAADDEGNCVMQTADGGYLIGGLTASFGAGETDWLVIKTDANGDSLWSIVLGGVNEDACFAIDMTLDGNYILTGHRDAVSSSGGDLWLIKLSAGGQEIWSRTFGGAGNQRGFAVNQLLDGSFMLAGRTLGSGGFPDFWLLSTTSDPSPRPPGPFMRLLPEDSTQMETSLVQLAWTPSIDPNGDAVTYLIHVESPTYPFPDPADYSTTDTTIEIEIPFLLDEPLDEMHSFFWTVHASAGGDTVEATNGEGVFYMDISGTDDNAFALPTEFGLSVYPNPFNSSAMIRFTISRAGAVQLVLYDVTGREVKSVISGFFPVGEHEIAVDAAELPSGVLFARLTGEGQTITRKLVLMR